MIVDNEDAEDDDDDGTTRAAPTGRTDHIMSGSSLALRRVETPGGFSVQFWSRYDGG